MVTWFLRLILLLKFTSALITGISVKTPASTLMLRLIAFLKQVISLYFDGFWQCITLPRTPKDFALKYLQRRFEFRTRRPGLCCIVYEMQFINGSTDKRWKERFKWTRLLSAV